MARALVLSVVPDEALMRRPLYSKMMYQIGESGR